MTRCSRQLVLEPVDNERLANLCGQFDQHLKQIEDGLGVEILGRGGVFQIRGQERPVKLAMGILRDLYEQTDRHVVGPDQVHLSLREQGAQQAGGLDGETRGIAIRTRRGTIRGRGENQNRYLENIQRHDVNFGVGPAGTGKTWLAVACAVEALQTDRVQRLILVRPAVEAGERLGFLPGDLVQKVDPYLRPLYDALYEMLGFERVGRLIERNVIEVAPLAFMRGRTLNDAFIILDEAQNTTVEQMKMFLTRIGFGSTAVITGDVTQVDLPRNTTSGLRHALQVLQGVEGVSVTRFNPRDVVRHRLVQSIIEAYERHEDPA